MASTMVANKTAAAKSNQVIVGQNLGEMFHTPCWIYEDCSKGKGLTNKAASGCMCSSLFYIQSEDYWSLLLSMEPSFRFASFQENVQGRYVLHMPSISQPHVFPEDANAYLCMPSCIKRCHMLSILQNVFGNATEGFSLFNSAGYGQSDLLFSDATHHLQRVLGSYTSWLGPSYTTILQAFECEGKSNDVLLFACVHNRVYVGLLMRSGWLSGWISVFFFFMCASSAAALITALFHKQAFADGRGGRYPAHQLPPHPAVSMLVFCLPALPSVSLCFTTLSFFSIPTFHHPSILFSHCLH